VLTDLTPLSSLLGDKTAKAFEKQLAITTVADLLQHYPRRYSKRGELTDFSSLPIGEVVTVVGKVISTNQRRMKGRKGSIFEVVLGESDSTLTLAFFNQSWRQSELHEGVTGLFSGKIGSFSNNLQLTHPDYELFNSEVIESQARLGLSYRFRFIRPPALCRVGGYRRPLKRCWKLESTLKKSCQKSY